MNEQVILDALARIEARQAKIEALLSRIGQDPPQVNSVMAEINMVRLAGGDLAQHYQDKFRPGNKKQRRKST